MEKTYSEVKTDSDHPQNNLPPLPASISRNGEERDEERDEERNLKDPSKIHPFQMNPVGRKEIKEEILQNETYFRYLLREIKTYFVAHIPIEVIRGLPRSYKYIFGAVAYMLSLSIYSYYVYYNFVSFYDSPYISLRDSASASCSSVSISISNSFLADIHGRWEGSNNFYYSKSPYSFTFSAFQISSTSQYEVMMNLYYQELVQLGAHMKNYDLAVNLVIWNSFVRYYSLSYPLEVLHSSYQNGSSISEGSLQYFEFSSTPKISYFRSFYGFSYGTIQGVCNVSRDTSYDQADGVFSVDYSYAQLQQSNCWQDLSAVVASVSVGRVTSFNLQLNVESFSTALAVNLGIENVGNLLSVSTAMEEIYFQGVAYLGAKYVDIRYPEMKPIYCLSTKESQNVDFTLCLVVVNRGVFLPVTNHLGIRLSSPPVKCDCTNAIGYSVLCNQFNLMLSLIAFPFSTQDGITHLSHLAQSGIYQAIALYQKYNQTYRNLNEAAYLAAATTVLQEINTSRTGESSYNNTDEFSFCTLPNKLTCSLLTFFTIDDLGDTISHYQYKLVNGSCRDTVTVNDSVWQRLIDTPPTSFTEPYFECYPSWFKSTLYATGVANGVTNLTMFLLLCVLLPIVYITLACLKGLPPPAEYSKVAKNITLDTFATILLRIQDDNYEGVEKEGLLDHLTRELIHSVQYAEELADHGSIDMNYPEEYDVLLSASQTENEPYLQLATMTHEDIEVGRMPSQSGREISPLKKSSFYFPRERERGIELLTEGDTIDSPRNRGFSRGESVSSVIRPPPSQSSQRSEAYFSVTASSPAPSPMKKMVNRRLGVDRIDRPVAAVFAPPRSPHCPPSLQSHHPLGGRGGRVRRARTESAVSQSSSLFQRRQAMQTVNEAGEEEGVVETRR